MIRRNVAIHEAGHAVIAHFGGFKVGVMTLKDGDGEIGFLRGKEPNPLAYIWMVAAGCMADFMGYGDSFWERNPKALMRNCSDMKTLRAFDFDEISTKTEIKKLLHNLHTFLSQPHIWGKVEWLADELMDHPKGLDSDIDFLVIQCQRERVPENDPAPLIKFIVDELFGRN